MPGHSDTVAVAVPISYIYASEVEIYDSGVARTNTGNGPVQCCSGVTGLAFDSTGTKLYEAGSGFGVATVDSTGITSGVALNASVSTNNLRIDNGRAYLSTGVILEVNTGNQLGVFSVGQNQNANGPVAPDSTIGEGFVLTSPNFGSNLQINAYDLATFVLNGFTPVAGVNSFGQNPSSLTRWGQDGLAFTTGSQIYVLRSPLVRDLSTSLADLNVTATVPGSGATGTNLTYTLKIKNAGPLAATPATLIDNIPVGSTFQGVTASQGTCTGGAVVVCDLGNLSSGSSATVQITVTPISSGMLTNTASVSAPQGDPNPADNSVISNTSITGSVYNPSPALLSISPDFVQAGSSSFTLTINGSGFGAGSTVQLNGTALPTTFVSTTQLTATVDASHFASLGWSWINVVNPVPGGGNSSSLPLTSYMVVSLDLNRLSFDPFTRKLYASVPSTATQVKGNSLIAIDPASGSLGAPLNIGSEPNRVAESSDGKYLYIGLDGSKSLTRVDLTSMIQGPIYSLTLPGGGTPATPFAARDLAVAPGNDNQLAIDPGYSVQSVASVVIQRESCRTPIRSIRTIGGFAGGYQLVGGLVFGFGGGVSNPTTTPPTQLGQFSVNSAQGGGQSIEGTGVAVDPDPTLGRAFYLGETLAGSANPVLLSFDSNRYVLLGMEQFTGAAQGQDLVRWGRDGLAWHSSSGGAFGNSTPGSGQLFLVRGPFVLPEWGTANAVPGLVSVAPSSIAAGSGNLILVVTGSGFVPGAVVTWNGAERTTTFVDSSHLNVAIPASDVSHAGTVTLIVNNPGSANSGSISFAVN